VRPCPDSVEGCNGGLVDAVGDGNGDSDGLASLLTFDRMRNVGELVFSRSIGPLTFLNGIPRGDELTDADPGLVETDRLEAAAGGLKDENDTA